jgi:hypothetical protein
MQFDSEKPDKITRGACACNDDNVIFENPLNWTTRSFIFAKPREYENGPPTPEPSGELTRFDLRFIIISALQNENALAEIGQPS